MAVRTRNLSHVYSVDGLRVLALLGVIFFHMSTTTMPGGFFGVVIFFVLAGFFTSRNMVLEQSDGSFPPLIPYYRKKFIRLYLPLLAAVVAVNLWTFFFQPNIYGPGMAATPSVLLGFNNFYQLSSGMSYFEMHGNFQPYTQMWALAMEIQFYLIYPVLIRVLAFIFRNKVNRVSAILWLISIASAIYMALNYVPGSDPTNVYYSTLARAHAFTIGGALAFSSVLSLEKISLAKVGNGDFNGPHGIIKPLQERGFYRLGPTPFNSLLALILLIALIVPYFTAAYPDDFVFRGGMFLYALLVGIFVIVIYHDDSILTPVLASAPMRIIAKRSYSYFIWQYPIMIMFTAGLAHSTISHGVSNFLQLILLIVIGEISYRFLEKGPAKRPYYKTPELAAGITPILGFATGLMLILAIVFPGKAVTNDAELVGQRLEEIQANRERLEKEQAAIKPPLSEETSLGNSQAETGEPTAHKGDKGSSEVPEEELTPSESAEASKPVFENKQNANNADSSYSYTDDELATLSNLKVTLIGDSVLDMSSEDLAGYLQQADIDAKISRQMSEGIKILEAKAQNGELGDLIVIALGTNGTFNSALLDQALELSGNRPLLFVNVVSPGQEEQQVNKMLSNFVEEHQADNVYLVDWYGQAKTQAELFYNDATHPKPQGVKLYNKLLMDKILEVL
ncbi:MAG: acyltransferase family protein [Coriobacteriia bacterium]|nr:acyltransferase family protein [Coriobacteriia bacterium]